MGFFKSLGRFFTGSPEKRENVSTLRPEQEGLYNQAVNAGMQRGAGGAFGGAADYYRGLLDDTGGDFGAMAAPQLRQYNQDIMPGISEQFAGMGAGGLSSSGFQNAQVQGATDLSERLGAIRAQLRQQGAQGLQNIGNQGLQSYSQNMTTRPGTEGFLSQISPLAGQIAGAYMGGPQGAAVGQQAANWFSGGKGKSSPYGGGEGPSASPQINNPYQGSVGGGGGFQLPSFGQTGMRRGF